MKLDQLRPGTSGLDLTVKVVNSKVVLQKPATKQTRPLRIAECIVGDDSGVVVFSARNEQVDQMKEGAVLHLKNARVELFRGSMRLAVDKTGKIEPAEGVDLTPKEDFNLSLVEYEVITVMA
eukprot:TRINITY_DN818_c0_g1_i1.p1 TRINITY_DN818_c0_g1~~TRINITY_DN818_c0_g1_i1.p1  ORF type:complete len:122 (+),score=17.13 TRINITY_DN818_c0_g1_i1:120-485(+)